MLSTSACELLMRITAAQRAAATMSMKMFDYLYSSAYQRYESLSPDARYCSIGLLRCRGVAARHTDMPDARARHGCLYVMRRAAAKGKSDINAHVVVLYLLICFARRAHKQEPRS
jgi:hypothetical protein